MSKLVSLWGSPIQGYVADVCAGSGALGLELLSRGAKHATFVDINVHAAQDNLRLLSVPSDRYQVIQQGAHRPLPPWPYSPPLDVLVADPPYNIPFSSTWACAWMPWLTPNHTLVCVEQETNQLCLAIEGLELIQAATYGKATWTVWMPSLRS